MTKFRVFAIALIALVAAALYALPVTQAERPSSQERHL